MASLSGLRSRRYGLSGRQTINCLRIGRNERKSVWARRNIAAPEVFGDRSSNDIPSAVRYVLRIVRRGIRSGAHSKGCLPEIHARSALAKQNNPRQPQVHKQRSHLGRSPKLLLVPFIRPPFLENSRPAGGPDQYDGAGI